MISSGRNANSVHSSSNDRVGRAILLFMDQGTQDVIIRAGETDYRIHSVHLGELKRIMEAYTEMAKTVHY